MGWGYRCFKARLQLLCLGHLGTALQADPHNASYLNCEYLVLSALPEYVSASKKSFLITTEGTGSLPLLSTALSSDTPARRVLCHPWSPQGIPAFLCQDRHWWGLLCASQENLTSGWKPASQDPASQGTLGCCDEPPGSTPNVTDYFNVEMPRKDGRDTPKSL